MAADMTPKELRQFGIVFGAIIALLFGAALPWFFNHTWPWWPWALGAVLIAWALVYPAGLKPVYRAWMAFGHAAGWVNSRLILGVAFLAVILPTAIVMRISRHDPMARTLNKERPSYRVVSTNRPKNHFERPF